MFRQSFRFTLILLVVVSAPSHIVADEFRFSIDRGKTIDSTISFVNECGTTKHFDVTGHALSFVSFLGEDTGIPVDPDAVETIGIRFDSRDLASGLYDKGYFEINCTDCTICKQDKRTIPVIMRVIEPTTVLDPCCEGNPGPDCTEKWWVPVDSFTQTSSRRCYTPTVLPADVAAAHINDFKISTTETAQIVVESSVSITGGSDLKEPLTGTLKSGTTFAVKNAFRKIKATSVTKFNTYSTFEFSVERQFWKEVQETRWILEANVCCWESGKIPKGPQLSKWLEDWVYEPSTTGRESILVELNTLIKRKCFGQRAVSFRPFRERLMVVTTPETVQVHWKKNPVLTRKDMLRDLEEIRNFLEGAQVHVE